MKRLDALFTVIVVAVALWLIVLTGWRASAQNREIARAIAANGPPLLTPVTGSIGPDPMAIPREGFSFPVTGGNVRINVCLLAVDTGEALKVRLWRHRAGKFTKVRTITFTNTPRQINLHQFPLPSGFVPGDVVIIELAPGMLTFSAQRTGAHPLAMFVPFASVIDNASNDPMTVETTRIRFLPEEDMNR